MFPGFLLTTSDRIVLGHYLPQLQVARYSAVYNIAAIPLLLLGLLDTVWLPRFFALRDEGVRTALSRRGQDAVQGLEEVIRLDAARRALLPELEGLRAEQNEANARIRSAARARPCARRSPANAGCSNRSPTSPIR